MHVLATGSYILAQSAVLHRLRKQKEQSWFAVRPTAARRWCSVLAGTLAMLVAMALWNLLFTPYFMGVSYQVLWSVYPFILLFNLIKAALNGTLAALLYEACAPIWSKKSNL
jgi:riboflavin transporter FmnP